MDPATDTWRDVLARHGPALLLFARQWGECGSDAQDAVQEGFVRYWRARSRARDDLDYLYACVRTAALDLARTSRRMRARETQMAPVHGSAPAFVSCQEHHELAQTVEQSLGHLPAEQRQVIVMKIWGGLTFAQIAKALGVSLNTAASRYRYALQHLEAELSEEVDRD